jgi:hypothetical protein
MPRSNLASKRKRRLAVAGAVVADADDRDRATVLRIPHWCDRNRAAGAAERCPCVVTEQHTARKAARTRADNQKVGALRLNEVVQAATHRGRRNTDQLAIDARRFALLLEQELAIDALDVLVRELGLVGRRELARVDVRERELPVGSDEQSGQGNRVTTARTSIDSDNRPVHHHGS